MLHHHVTSRILKGFYRVYNTLGYGFLEKVYEHALAYELHRDGLRVRRQVPLIVRYDDIIVGEYVADLIIEDAVLCELKAGEGIVDEHRAQLRNYLRATPVEVGLLLHFGPTPRFERMIHTNDRKPNPSKSV